MGSGRRSVAWPVRVCSLVIVVGLSVPLYQFPVRFPMLGRLFQGIHGCLPRVRFRPILCVSVRSCSSRPALRLVASDRLSVRFSSRVSRRWGGAAVGGCLLARSIAAMGRAMSLISPRLASRLFATGSGEAAMSGVSPCLLGCRTGAVCGVPCLFRLPCGCLSPCRSVRTMSDEMRMLAAGRYRVPAAALLAVLSRPAHRQGGRGGRRNER